MSRFSPNVIPLTVMQTAHTIPLCIGLPGGGKTSSLICLANAVGRKLAVVCGATRQPEEIGGIPYPVPCEITDPRTGHKVSLSFKLLAPDWATNTWDGDKWIILFDEFCGNSMPMQSALASALAERRVGDLPLPEDVWMIAATNQAEHAANGHEIAPNIANRLAFYKWVRDEKAAGQGFARGMRMVNGHPRWEFPPPNVPVLPANWYEHTSTIGSMVNAFWDRFPSLIEAYPKTLGEAAGPWPSLRSWDRGIVAKAAVRSVGCDRAQELTALEGCVGMEAAKAYADWEHKLDLPDTETEIEKARKCVPADRKRGTMRGYTFPSLNRADRALAFMAACSDATCVRECTQERVEAMGVILAGAWAAWKELAYTGAKLWADKVRPDLGWWIPNDILQGMRQATEDAKAR